MKTLLKGGRVLDPAQNKDQVADVLINGAVIEAVDSHIPDSAAEQVVPLSAEQWVTPGLIDLHVHFRDPGQSSKETTVTGAASAVAGGFTTVCVMPNTLPPLDSLPMLAYMQQAISTALPIKILPIAAITKQLQGQELTEMRSLYERGAVGFSDDGYSVMNANVMKLALEYSTMFGAPIMCHAEDTCLSCSGVMNKGYYSTLLGLPGYPNAAESVMVARDIELARVTGGHVHFAHVSCHESVELIRRAKHDGLKITAEVTPHHLALTDADVSGYDPDFKMNPPLRAEKDRQALITGLQEGVLDCIATDHAPHNQDEKSLAFDEAPNGVIGLETSVGVLLTHLVQPGLLSPLELIRRMSTNAARIIHQSTGTLAVGSPADVTVIDPTLSWVVDPTQFKSKSRNTPFKQQTLTGKATMVFAEGRCLLGAERMRSKVAR